jgi:hypothetical protein
VAGEVSNGHHENGHATTTVDSSLLHAIESVVIEWSHQVQDVLKKDSSQVLLDGGSPLPGVEVEFWRSRYTNLLNIHEQVKYLFIFLASQYLIYFLVKRSTSKKNGGIITKNPFKLLSSI